MQQPTLSGVRIRSSNDVHRIFYAVRIGLLKMLERRLDNEEREALGSGCIYVWEVRGSRQSNDVTGEGMDRFTEGKQWGPSRVRDVSRLNNGSKSHTSSQTHPWDYLVKQTYSAWVDIPTGRRKWQLTAYFTDNTVDTLRTIDDFPSLRDVQAPFGMFQSTKTRTSKSKRKESQEHLEGSQLSSSVTPNVPSLSFSPEPLTMAQSSLGEAQLPAPRRLIPVLPRPPLNGGASVPIRDHSINPTSWSSPPLLGDRPVYPTHPQPGHIPFSLPPVCTFGENHLGLGMEGRTPSSLGSGVHSLLWDSSYKLSSRASSVVSNRENRLALAPIRGLNRRRYFRDPLDDEALRSLPGVVD
ncbi:hypothetical protein C0991_004681 [Blastosporella zonata]|nr:hypothetical protein C0991_004681 [Blastosporella zonata]